MYNKEPPQITATNFVMIEGVVQESPRERHEHSRWLALKTAQDRVVRVVVAYSAPVSNWLEPGQTVRVSGRVVLKQWTDGLHPTVSAHEAVELIGGHLSMR